MFLERLTEAAEAVEHHLAAAIRTDNVLAVIDAMQHATRGGKRLRGFLVLETARLHGVDPAQAIWPAAGIEAMHAYSLVHDDLPAMDNDTLRRGQPTVHVKWDEATAILAGDALQSLAFELVGHPKVGSDAARATLGYTLAQAAGARGMVMGQAMDIAAETSAAPLSLDDITTLQQGKTGALIAWSAMAGPRLAQADVTSMQRYAEALGLAFQIADDILDVEGDAATLGKATRKDADAGKATFVSLLGLDAAKRRAADLVVEACDAVSLHGAAANTLRAAARFVVTRES
ncbi:MAG: polyprenyl synthetase family protein [Pseudomonadota bacterium]